MDNCPTDADSIGDEIFGWIITIGSFASFIPQIYSLITRKTPEGLSGVSWTMNYISNMGTFLNVFLLRWHITMCCKILSLEKCSANLLPVLQLGGPWLAVFIIYVLLAKYCRVSKRTLQETNSNSDESEHARLMIKSRKPQSRMDAIVELLFMNNDYVVELLVFSIFLTLVSAGIGILLVYKYGDASRHVVLYADIYGVFALILLVIQYIPQIYTTHKNKEAGSLSVATLLLQAPGAFAIVYFQAIMNGGSWTTWAPYLCTGVQQLFLAGQCFFYYLQRRRIAKKDTLMLQLASIETSNT